MIPFNRPFITGKELHNIAEAHARSQLAGDGYFTMKCSSWLEQRTGCHKALLTHSCTAALEMAAMLADIRPGDEIIMPSFTFVSTANAFVLRGGVPVFVDIRMDTLNIDESLIEAAITPRTRAIVAVHYAGVGCNMDAIMDIAKTHNLLVIEDAAQAVMASYKGKPLGSIGDLGCYSFHETKNIISGEGGALLINNPAFAERAEIIREKGTNRTQFMRGSIDKYMWIDIGSSYLPGELIAAFLWAQMEEAQSITANRISIWNAYDQGLSELSMSSCMQTPTVPEDCQHNAHMYYLIFDSPAKRHAFTKRMHEQGCQCIHHYVPLHSAPAGRHFARVASPTMKNTQRAADSLVRLPLWIGVETDAVLNSVAAALSHSE